MLVRFFGFNWRLGKQISLDDLFAHFKVNQGKPENFSGAPRRLYVDRDGNFHLGVFFTVRQPKRFCAIVDDKRTVRVEFREMDDNARIAEFNFFAIHRHKGVGIYQHYHHSCSLNQFYVFAKRRFNTIREKRNLSLAPGNKISDTFGCEHLWRREDFEQRIKELARIKSFECKVKRLISNEREFRPLSEEADTASFRVGFRRRASSQILRAAVLSGIKSDNVIDGKVVGVDEDNLEKVVRLFNEPSSFGEVDYELVSKGTDINLDDLKSNEVMQRILYAVREKPSVFGK